MAEKNKTTRKFSYTRPILYNGESYPSAEADITYDGTTTQGRIFADANGQYYTMDSNNNVLPVMPVNELDEVTVTAPKEDILAGAFNRYLTRTDNTRVNNLPHREYNTQLKEDAERGMKGHGIWVKEHPNLAAWGTVASAIPFAVAAAPFVAGGGSALLSTTAGQAARSGIAALMSNPIVEAANNAIGLGFASKGMYDVSQGKFTPETAMDFMGLYPAARSLTNLAKAKRAATNVNEVFPKTFGKDNIALTNVEDIDLGDLVSQNYPLKGETEIPIGLRKEAAKKYTEFINSKEYQNRLQRTGLEGHWNYMKDLTDRRVNNIGYFPTKVQVDINGDPEILGLSAVEPSSPNYGISLQEDLPIDEARATLMHELSHWATGNAGINDMANSVKYPFVNDPNSSYIGDIMRYNESIAPNITWDEVLNNLPKSTPIDKVMEIQDTYNYLIRPTEKRARAMSVYQQAKDANMSIDAFVDKYTRNGRIAPTAPMNLQQLGETFTVDNLKKYLKNFLSISAPIGIATSINNNQYEQ